MGINKKTLSKSFTKKYSIRHGNDMTYNKKTKEILLDPTLKSQWETKYNEYKKDVEAHPFKYKKIQDI